MEKRYRINKKGSISMTMSWVVATTLIIFMIVIYLLIASFINKGLAHNINNQKFISNSFGREISTFLDEKVTLQEKNTSVKEMLKTLDFKKENGQQTPEGKKLKEIARKYLSEQDFKKSEEKKDLLDRYMVELENTQETNYPIFLTYKLRGTVDGRTGMRSETPTTQNENSPELEDSSTGEIDWQNYLAIETRPIDMPKKYINKDGELFREIYLTKNKKIIYHAKY